MGEDKGGGKQKEVSSLSPTQRLKLLQGASGIYFFFITSGRLQERIFRFTGGDGRKFTAVWFLQLADALANVLVAGVGRRFEGTTPGLPQSLLFYSGLGQVVSKYCLSASLAAGLSFPVATLAKSAKMAPVMVGSLILGGASFSRRQIAQASAIVGGTSLVTLCEGKGNSGHSSTLGLTLILVALACDGMVGGVQKRLKVDAKARKQDVRGYDLMFWTNVYMAASAFVFAAARRELRQGLAFCRANPSMYGQILKFAACGAMGQACIFYTIAHFDSVVCTAVTTTRKLASVLLSLAEGDKSLPPMGWLGLGVASAGIIGEAI